MSTALGTVRDALKTRLAGITTLHVYDTMPDSITVPAAIIRPLNGDYYTSLGKEPHIFFEILILVSLARLTTAQDNLDPYLNDAGASSIVAAIEADPTLGSNAETALVMGWRDYGGIIIGNVEYLSARIDVEVWL